MSYIVYPSAKVFVPSPSYMDAVDVLVDLKTPSCFYDGKTILIPESEHEVINILRDCFNARIEYGHGQEGEFATRASFLGISPELISLGNAVQLVTNISVGEMIQQAVTDPIATEERWKAIYLEGCEVAI